ncbi:NTE family protein [Crossiella equi]|uniref:NTE family protein n=1 Tax=Crossiella equi TaxID=130796 RepID=A0ABS5AD35_9PSEU|nr:patatin-like phospholipase family protein [Crossiella equi]MBP2473620.1 NTE family protein [Crossiella equi]
MTGGLALVLSGGGAQAAYFGAGVAQGLAELGCAPRIYSGTSAGALNTGLLASGITPDALVHLWSELSSSDVYRFRADLHRLLRPWHLLRLPGDPVGRALDVVGWTWLLDPSPARKTLGELTGSTLSIRDDVVAVVSAVEQHTGAVTRFVNALPPAHRRTDDFRQVELSVEHLLASAAAPVLFPPVAVAGVEYTDAGLVANTPLSPALAYEPDRVVVVASSRRQLSSRVPAEAPESLDDALGQLFANVARFAVEQDFRHAQTVNELARAGATERRQVELVLVEPSSDFAVSGFVRFSPGSARAVAAHGRSRVLELLGP